MTPLDVLFGILGLACGLVVIVLVAWFVVMLIHLLINVIPDRLNDMKLGRTARRQRQGH